MVVFWHMTYKVGLLSASHFSLYLTALTKKQIVNTAFVTHIKKCSFTSSISGIHNGITRRIPLKFIPMCKECIKSHIYNVSSFHLSVLISIKVSIIRSIMHSATKKATIIVTAVVDIRKRNKPSASIPV
jgi:hypothetical protein